MGGRPVAVVYADAWTGPESGDDTAAAAAAVRTSGFDTVIAGPNGDESVRVALRRPNARLYVQPGAAGDDHAAFARLRRDKGAIRRFVASGGRYLGLCMGGFLAEPGFLNLLPARVDEYWSRPGTSVRSPDPTTVQVLWRDEWRELYFQDGGVVVPTRRNAAAITVLARYPEGGIAAAVAPFGDGRVGVCGPHPEAPDAWFTDHGYTPAGSTADLCDDLVRTLMDGALSPTVPADRAS